jgi:hypothetical protein
MQQKAIRYMSVLLAAGALVAAVPLAAQDPPPPPPVPVTQPPVTPPPATEPPVVPIGQDPLPVVQDPPVTTPPVDPEPVMKPERASREIDPQRRREQVVAMEGLLATAVRNAASAAARQMQAVEPGVQYFTGIALAKGYYLEDYGVFFHVDIPGVSPYAQLRMMLDNMAGNPGFGDRDRGLAQPARAVGGRSIAFDPDAAYVLAVQQRLIDTMLDYRIDLHPDEWLTVAARDGEAPPPGQIVDSATMILRVRASDLADYFAGRITRAEIRARVEVREF